MTQLTRRLIILAVLVLVLAACGDSEGESTTTAASDGGTATESTPAPDSDSGAESTTAAPETTEGAATTEAATTSAPAAAGDADERARAVTEAAAAAVPDGWETSFVEVVPEEDPGVDDIYGTCTEPGAFDVAMLNEVTAAISTLQVDAPAPDGGFIPGGSASVEGRVFESEAVAADAFGVLETVVGSEAGRQCLADEFLSLMPAEIDPGTEMEFTITELDVAGADVGARISVGMAVEGFSFQIQVDLAAARAGDISVYGSFLGFGEPFDETVRDDMFQAAVGAA